MITIRKPLRIVAGLLIAADILANFLVFPRLPNDLQGNLVFFTNVILNVVAVPVGLVALFSFLIPKLPLEINPRNINLVSGGFRTRAVIRVYNNLDTAIHQICVKFSADSASVSLSQLSIQVPSTNSETRIEDALPGQGIDIICQRFDGVDPTGNQAIYLIINTIERRKELAFVIVDGSSSHAPAKLTATLLASSLEPALVVYPDAGGVAFRFKMPENVTQAKISPPFIYRVK